MILKGRPISKGKGRGEVLLLDETFSFLGGVDPRTGELSSTTGLLGANLKDRVFAFRMGKGSTVGSYTLLQLKKEGNLPAAIINNRAETIVATGAVMASVPMVDSIDLALLHPGDEVAVDGEAGTVDLFNVKESRVVTSVLTNQGRILALKRSEKVSSCQNMWAGVSGYIEPGETPLQTAMKEVEEETSVHGCRPIRQADPILVRQSDMVWVIHPFLMECPTESITIDWEHTEYRWISPSQVDEHVTVPGFRRVLRSLGL